jgi:hypothetical protein
MSELALAAGMVSAASSVAGGVASITQSRAQAKAIQQAGDYNARAAEIETAVTEERLRRDQRRQLSRLRASIAGRGVTVEGSPLEILADSAAEAEEDALLVRYMGTIRAQQTRYGAQTESTFVKSRGLAAGLGSFGRGTGTILGSVGEYIEPRGRRGDSIDLG